MSDVFLFCTILITSLGDERWPVREAAHASLAQLGDLPLPFLDLASRDPDPEIRWRAHRLIELRLDSVCRSFLARLPVVPWIDSLPLDYPERDELISRYLGPCSDRPSGPPDWPQHRAATRGMVRDLLLSGMDRGELQGLLDRMAARERLWDEAGKRYTDQ